MTGTDRHQSTTTPTEEKEKYTWRMHQPTESRKYQLFPAKEKLSMIPGRKSPDTETGIPVAMGQNGPTEKERSLLGVALRLKSKEPPIIRRRKVSVPELGPMTTVQEISMDSREFHSSNDICMMLKRTSNDTRSPATS